MTLPGETPGLYEGISKHTFEEDQQTASIAARLHDANLRRLQTLVDEKNGEVDLSRNRVLKTAKSDLVIIASDGLSIDKKHATKAYIDTTGVFSGMVVVDTRNIHSSQLQPHELDTYEVCLAFEPTIPLEQSNWSRKFVPLTHLTESFLI